MTTCVKCGCTDDHACDGGCFWALLSDRDLDHRGTVYPRGDLGICSACDIVAGPLPDGFSRVDWDAYELDDEPFDFDESFEELQDPEL